MKTRLKAATPGPWMVRSDHAVVQVAHSTGEQKGVVVYGPAYLPDAEFIAHASADLAKLHAALDAVEALHRPVSANITGTPYSLTDHDVCPKCFNDDGWPVSYPCPTVKAIRDALGEDQ
jgi:hypothetical protein